MGPIGDIPYCCPCDLTPLVRRDNYMHCSTCGTEYPVVREIPVLIDDRNSVFSRQDYLGHNAYSGASYGGASDREKGLRARYRRFGASLAGYNVRLNSVRASDAVEQMLSEFPGKRILVIGAGHSNYFTQPNVLCTDVAFGAHVSAICDAHSLPFPNEYFSGVVAMAVLEHVADPYRCVEEIHRVLVDGGMVFASTPFLQPVHMGAYDFTRFTYLGHRRLFRWFDDIESGCILGPGASAAFALSYLLLSISDNRWYRRFARLVGLVLSLLIKQLDHFVGRTRGAYDAAGGTFFFGRKRGSPISDRDMIKLYRGAQG